MKKEHKQKINSQFKVCLFGTYFPEYSRNSLITDGLRQLGAEVVIVQKGLTRSQIETTGDLNLSSTLKRIYGNIEASIYFLSQFKKAAGCDIIVVLYPGHLILPVAKIISFLSGKPLVFDSFTSLYDTLIIDRNISEKASLKTSLLKKAEALLLKLPDKIFVDTKMMKKFHIDNFGIDHKKIFTIPLGANSNIYSPKDNKENKTIKVTTFGTYNPLQGAIHIVKAAQLLKKDKRIIFTLIGSGVLKKEIVAYAKKQKIGNIIFKDFLPENKLVQELKKSDIMLGIFSDNDLGKRAIPNKVFAAIACRKPLITAETAACKEYLKHKEDVFYCRPEDPVGLAAAINTLARDKNLRKRIARGGYETYLKNFTNQVITEKLLKNLMSISQK